MQTIICTVGTSLLSNASREIKSQVTREVLQGFISQAGEERASAETNSLKRILQDGDEVVFMYSETEEGALCAEALASYYQNNRKINARTRQVSGLSYAHRSFAMKGLKQLVDDIIDEIRKARSSGREPAVNATGGFKAEIAYATLVGLLFKVPVHYIHEKFQDIIEMPAVPVDWDYTMIAENEDFFEWLQRELRRKEKVENQLKVRPPALRQFLMEEDGYVVLSPTGEVYFQAYQDVKAAARPVLLSEKARKYYESLDGETKTAFARLLRRLGLDQMRASQSETKNKSDCLVYPQGNCKERIFYYEQDGRIYVCEIACHGDNYEHLLDNKGVYRDEYGGFQPWDAACGD